MNEQEEEKPKRTVVPHLNLDSVKNSNMEMATGSAPSSPMSMRRTPGAKMNCLCSPTTHVGSFRCRYHRNSGLARSSMSVGSKLNELADKPTEMCDGLHAQQAYSQSGSQMDCLLQTGLLGTYFLVAKCNLIGDVFLCHRFQ